MYQNDQMVGLAIPCTNFSNLTDFSLRPEWVQKMEPASASPKIPQIAALTATSKIQNWCKNEENPREIGGFPHAIWSPN